MTFPYDVATEKVSMMYSSGDYPDAVGGWLLGAADITKYGVNEGVYIPIEEYIEKYAPRFTYLLENFPNAKQDLTLPDGHIYTIPLMGKQPGTRYVMHINQTWLDKLNLEMPKTTDDFTKVLEAFAAGDPNGHGKNDEIPLGMRGDSIGDLFGWFGLPDTTEHIVMSDGKPVYTVNTEGYKEAIKYLRSLFDKKLLDQETFTQDTTQYDSKGKEPDEVYGAFLDWHGVNIVGEERYKEDYTVMPVLSSPTCDDPKWGQGDAWIFRTQTAITSAAKNPATIVRWFDYVYDEDNSLQVR